MAAAVDTTSIAGSSDDACERQFYELQFASEFEFGFASEIACLCNICQLGAWIEFDFRNTLEGGRMDAIRQVGPELCFLSEFWTKVDGAREYAGAGGR
jgi:hypothetical protein